jgi:hypothetical protein
LNPVQSLRLSAPASYRMNVPRSCIEMLRPLRAVSYSPLVDIPRYSPANSVLGFNYLNYVKKEYLVKILVLLNNKNAQH